MPIEGIPTRDESYALASDLAKIYMQTQDSTKRSPSEFAEKYLEVQSQIFQVLRSKV